MERDKTRQVKSSPQHEVSDSFAQKDEVLAASRCPAGAPSRVIELEIANCIEGQNAIHKTFLGIFFVHYVS